MKQEAGAGTWNLDTCLPNCHLVGLQDLFPSDTRRGRRDLVYAPCYLESQANTTLHFLRAGLVTRAWGSPFS